MPEGKKFNLTDDRIKKLTDLLGRQYSVIYVANKFGISACVLSTKMNEIGLDAKTLKREGINTLKAKLYDGISDINEPDKKAKASLDFLKQYDKSDDVVEDKSNAKQIVFQVLPKNDSAT